jgi:hypothetical protein
MFEVVYSIRGDKCQMRVALSRVKSLARAKAYCRDLKGPLANALHYSIIHEDGRFFWNTEKNGLLD